MGMFSRKARGAEIKQASWGALKKRSGSAEMLQFQRQAVT